MPSFSSYNALGTTIEQNELGSGSVSYVKLGTDLFKAELIEAVSETSSTTGLVSSTFTEADFVMVDFICGKLSTGSADIQVVINTLSANYGWQLMTNGSGSYTTGTSQFKVGTSTNSGPCSGRLFITAGQDLGHASVSRITMTGNVFSEPNAISFLGGKVNSALSEGISKVTIKSGSNAVAGDMFIYKLNRVMSESA